MSVATVTIANGASESEVLRLSGGKLAGLIMPDDWTAATITFLVSDKPDGTFVPLYDDGGNEVTVTTVAASTGIAMDVIAASLAQWSWIKIRSGTSAVPVNQAAGRLIKVVVK